MLNSDYRRSYSVVAFQVVFHVLHRLAVFAMNLVSDRMKLYQLWAPPVPISGPGIARMQSTKLSGHRSERQLRRRFLCVRAILREPNPVPFAGSSRVAAKVCLSEFAAALLRSRAGIHRPLYSLGQLLSQPCTASPMSISRPRTLQRLN
jgi:hypothetical protein